MILELGLRFRPQATADQEEYSAAVALLAVDVCDIPESLLEAAIKEWVRCKRFLPRASELIGLAQEIQRGTNQGTDAAARQLQSHCDRLNAMNGGRDGWRVVGKAPNRTIAKARECRNEPA